MVRCEGFEVLLLTCGFSRIHSNYMSFSKIYKYDELRQTWRMSVTPEAKYARRDAVSRTRTWIRAGFTGVPRP